MMNERIKGLKAQCWDERPYGPPWFNSDKFAELIVNDCANFVQFYYKDHACEMIAHDMKQHFKTK